LTELATASNTTARTAIREDDAQQLVYFMRDFLLDGSAVFFSGVRVSSAGRKRQICSLTSTSSRLSCWWLRNSAISC